MSWFDGPTEYVARFRDTVERYCSTMYRDDVGVIRWRSQSLCVPADVAAYVGMYPDAWVKPIGNFTLCQRRRLERDARKAGS